MFACECECHTHKYTEHTKIPITYAKRQILSTMNLARASLTIASGGETSISESEIQRESEKGRERESPRKLRQLPF